MVNTASAKHKTISQKGHIEKHVQMTHRLLLRHEDANLSCFDDYRFRQREEVNRWINQCDCRVGSNILKVTF